MGNSRVITSFSLRKIGNSWTFLGKPLPISETIHLWFDPMLKSKTDHFLNIIEFVTFGHLDLGAIFHQLASFSSPEYFLKFFRLFYTKGAFPHEPVIALGKSYSDGNFHLRFRLSLFGNRGISSKGKMGKLTYHIDLEEHIQIDFFYVIVFDPHKICVNVFIDIF